MKFEQPSRKESYKKIADEILQMAKQDQEMRERFESDPGAWDSMVDEVNTNRMKEIVEEIGWPSISKVGEEASDLAWLLVQHADRDPAFQKRCLELMKRLPEGAVSKSNLAYLEDRILVKEGKPQRFGTQFFEDIDGHVKVRPIEDPEHVDERREAMGLPPWEEWKNT